MIAAAVFSLALTGYSFARLKAARRYAPNSVDRLLFRAVQDDRTGDRASAVDLTGQAVGLLQSGGRDFGARHRMVLCAMDLARYGRRRQALALLDQVRSYPDATGKLAQRVFVEIGRNSPRWRVLPRPGPQTIAHRKAILQHHPDAVL